MGQAEKVGRAITFLIGGGKFVNAYDSLADAREATQLMRTHRECLSRLSTLASEYRHLTDKDAAECVAEQAFSSISPAEAKAIVWRSYRDGVSLGEHLLAEATTKAQLADMSLEGAEYARRLIFESAELFSRHNRHHPDASTIALLASDSETRAHLAKFATHGPQVTERILAIPTHYIPISIKGGEPIHIPTSGLTTVAAFIDVIWFYIRDQVTPFSYGKQWCLTIVDKSEHFIMLETSDAKGSRDDRLLLPTIQDTIGLELEFKSAESI
jgi:hypothetical protein